MIHHTENGSSACYRHKANYMAKILPLLFLVVIYSLGCDRRSDTPGAHPMEVASDYLLPDGRRWQYDLVLPTNVSAGDILQLDVRRFPIDEADQGLRSHERLSADKAEYVVAGPEFTLVSPKAGARVSLQLLDLRDFSESTAVNPIKLVGGLMVEGQLAKLRCDANFVVGENVGISPSTQASWDGNEIRLLRFWSSTNEGEYTYDVCVRIVKPE